MNSTARKGLIARLRRGKETRARLVENNLAEGIAFQIAATRNARGWTQERLAEEAGIANNLPRLEDPDYGKHTITSLKKLAAGLDIALVVRFVPFSQYIEWLSGTYHLDKGLSSSSLAVEDFAEEEHQGVFDRQPRSYFEVVTNQASGVNAEAGKNYLGAFSVETTASGASNMTTDPQQGALCA